MFHNFLNFLKFHNFAISQNLTILKFYDFTKFHNFKTSQFDIFKISQFYYFTILKLQISKFHVFTISISLGVAGICEKILNL